MVRRIARLVASTFFSVFVLTIILAVISEFFIEWAREKGWYANPSQRLDAGISAFNHFVTQIWFVMATMFAAGLTMGLWFDWVVRWIETRRSIKDELSEKQTLLELYDAVEATKKLLLTEELSPLSHDSFHEMTSICLKLAKLGVDIPFDRQYTENYTYEEFASISYRYLASIAPYLREGRLELVRFWAKGTLGRMKEEGPVNSTRTTQGPETGTSQ
ncbi:MAG: hypothetical protein ABSG18_23120 [Steroidobacteraceae bacterium]